MPLVLLMCVPSIGGMSALRRKKDESINFNSSPPFSSRSPVEFSWQHFSKTANFKAIRMQCKCMRVCVWVYAAYLARLTAASYHSLLPFKPRKTMKFFSASDLAQIRRLRASFIAKVLCGDSAKGKHVTAKRVRSDVACSKNLIS